MVVGYGVVWGGKPVGPSEHMTWSCHTKLDTLEEKEETEEYKNIIRGKVVGNLSEGTDPSAVLR